MLSTDSHSSIAQRRKFHRRQQSLEVPIIAAPLPAHNQRRPNSASSTPHGHRRGFSLDQNLNAHASPSGFRQFPPQSSQEHQHQPPRIHLDTTNIGHPTGPIAPQDQRQQQHFVQVTQQHLPAQPGYQAQDFKSHIHQQLNGQMPNRIVQQGNFAPPSDLNPHLQAHPGQPMPIQQMALQELQNHLDWYSNNYGKARNPAMPMNAQFANDMNCAQPIMIDMAGVPVQVPMPMPQAPQGMAQVPMAHAVPRTVPNTPQSFANGWPSPPPTTNKGTRSQSFQLDVAPMIGHPHPQMMKLPQTPRESFAQDSVIFSNDGGYASSVYSSSVADPVSPSLQHSHSRMPTLFEEPNASYGGHLHPSVLDQSAILLQATAGAGHNFDDSDYEFGGSSPNDLLQSLGADIPASILDTGISAYEVQQYIGELSEADNKYPCMWTGCTRRFGRKENVRAHVQTHLGDRQFQCDLCKKTFVRQHDLKRHVATHSADRPFVCPCGAGFARHDALTRHRQRGMCHGALPGFEKNEEDKPKRGRPKKHRPDMEARVDKANRTRQNVRDKERRGAGDAYASSSSGASDRSYPVTPPQSSDNFDTEAFLDLTNAEPQFTGVTANWRDTPPTSPVSASPTKTVDSFDPRSQGFAYNTAPTTRGISPAVLSVHSSPAASAHDANELPTTASAAHNIFDYVSPAASSSSFHGPDSSPLAEDNGFFNELTATTLATEPDISHDAFSPPGESHISSSPYNSSEFDGVGDASDPFFEFMASTGAKSTNSMLGKSVEFNNMNMLADMGSFSGDKSMADALDDWIMNH